jgi:hypothetical protein
VIKPTSRHREVLYLKKERFINSLNDIDRLDDVGALRDAIQVLAEGILNPKGDEFGIFSLKKGNRPVWLCKISAFC